MRGSIDENSWQKIKIEYITGDISLRDIAKKHNISFNSLICRSKKEEWYKNRIETRNKINTKTIQKMVEKASNKKVRDWEKELESIERINEVVLDALLDDKQFNKHLVQRKEKNLGIEITKVEEKIFSVVDSRRLKDLVSSLSIASQMKQLLTGFIAEKDRQILELQRENLALSKEKAGIGLEDNELGFIEMPAVDNEKYESEKEEEIRRREAKKNDS